MGTFDELLKGLPINAVLREKLEAIEAKHAALETEVAILKDDKRRLETENQKLKEQIKILTHIDNLDPTQEKILLTLTNPDSEHDEKALCQHLNQNPARVKYHLNELTRINYIYGVSVPGLSMATVYHITGNGITYLYKKSLI
jgi:predicted nuclease with TOPRIM domain